MEYLNHFIFGQMRFVEVDKESDTICLGCLDLIYGPAYVIVNVDDDDDKDHMHKACAELPPQIKRDAFHPHPLQIIIQQAAVCDGCGRLSQGFISYNCNDCSFNLDFKCAMALFNDELVEADIQKAAAKRIIKKGIIHFSHIHPLTRCMSSSSTTDDFWWVTFNFKCMACKQNTFDTLIYVCIPCNFCLHELCLNELKPRQGVGSWFHPQHILRLRPIRNTDTSHYCHACKEQVKGIGFYCSNYECSFDFHVSCAKYQTRAIKHVCHPHHLLHLGKSIIDSKWLSCGSCHKDFDEYSFLGCVDCCFYIHVDCLLPRVVKTRCHLHPLVLTNSFVEDDSGEYYCDLCETERNSEHHIYYCGECKYVAHVDCVLLEIEPTQQMCMSSLQIAENLDKMNNRILLEWQEMELHNEKQIIQKDVFHHPPLTLNEDQETLYVCDGCGELGYGLSYKCNQCPLFSLCMECFTSSDDLAKQMAQQGSRQIKTTLKSPHFSHPSDPLTRCKINTATNFPEDQICDCCVACQKDLGGLMYVCLVCGFILHESCLNDMPMQVDQISPFHPQHLLMPYPLPPNSSTTCDACGGDIKFITFYCVPCNLSLHSSCAKYQTHHIKHKRHEHSLLHLGKSIFVQGSWPQCDACEEDCNNTFFCCRECKFNMHPECIPLPYIIKHRRHLHPLTLENSFVEDDSEEYYCDVCETQRNPELDVYCCKECSFIAHIGCVISEDEPPEEILEYLVPRRNRIEAETKQDMEKA